MNYLSRMTPPHRHIVRIRTQNIQKDPNMHKSPKKSYFSYIKSPKLAISKNSHRQLHPLIDPWPSQISLETQHQKIHIKSDQFDKSVVSKYLSDAKVQKVLQKFKNKESILDATVFKKQQASDTKKQQNSKYLSYETYAFLSSEFHFSHAHFQQLAQINDHKHKTDLAKMSKQASINNNFYKNKIIDKPVAIFKKSRIKTVLNMTPQTILASDLGALSQKEIKKRLQKQWQQQQQIQLKKLKQTTNDIDQENQDRSRSTKSVKMYSSFDRKLSSDRIKGKPSIQQIDLKYRSKLNRIFQMKKRSDNSTEISDGKEYEKMQETILSGVDFYRVRKFVMKHKLGWRL